MKHEERREQLLQAALMAAAQMGYKGITRDEVAHRAEVSPGLVQFHFNSIEELRKATLEKAIENEDLKVFSQAFGALDETALGAPKALVDKAITFLETEAARCR